MSDLSGSSSFGNTDPQNVTRPKSQPIRLKALLHFCESDDDDDDDESEDKALESSEEESDLDEQPLPLDDFAKDMPQKLPLHETVIHSIETDAKNKNFTGSLVSESMKESHTDVSSVQEKSYCASDRKKCEIDINFENNLSMVESSKPEIYSDKHEERTQEDYSSTIISRGSQTANAVYDCSTDIALPPPPLSVYKSDHNVKPDAARSLQPVTGAESRHEALHAPDMLSRLLAKSSDGHSLHLSKEDRGRKSIVEQTSKDREEEYRRGILSATGSEFTSGSSIMLAAAGCRSSAWYEASERHAAAENARAEFNTPSLSDTMRKKSLTAINRTMAAETPLKHLRPTQFGAMHSRPCVAHKQLFRTTPQSKLFDEQSSKHYSATILSNWIPGGNTRHTPISGKSLIPKDRVQTPRPAVYTPVVGSLEASRLHFGVETKSARRPLMDAVVTHSDFSIYPLESKPSLLQVCLDTKYGTASESQQEDKSKKPIGMCSEMKSLQMAGANYENDLKTTNPVEETKENKQPNLPNPLIGNIAIEIAYDKKNTDKQTAIGPNTGLKTTQDSSQRYDVEDNVMSGRKDSSHDPCSVSKRPCEELRQIVNKVANVQFTVPSSVPLQRQGKTLFVKDREYLILGSLGRGMSGEVLRVQDVSCGELRAIKCVDLNKMDKESAQGCLDEISMLRKLQAPCVVRMFDYHIKESMVYVIMEMGDTDLSRLLKSMSQEKQIPLMMILYYWTEMLTAVKHIHDNGVIHSDLKPANFLLVRGRLKLIDFGIASSINSDMTSVLKNNPIGTLNYISPEALMDIGGNADSPTHNVKYKISFKSDVWSLGCILYSLVYGHTPFHHIRAQWAKVNAIINPKPNISFPATTYSSGGTLSCERAPPILIDVMRKCLQHDPKARPTVSELLQVQYVPTNQNVAPNSTLDVPANILVKIKHALNEDEWRELVQVLDTKRHHT